MKEKEKRIIEAAMSLFAKKGVTSTSIQDIVNECGISKGAFYLYFKSKDALLLETFKYHFELIHSKMQSVREEDLEPRALLIKQLSCQFSEINKHKDFIIMQMRENAVPNNPSVAAFIQKMNAEASLLVKNGLASIYGDSINPFIWDMTAILQGMIHSYLKYIIFDKAELDFEALSVFLVNRIDDMVSGLSRSDEEPILSGDELTLFSPCSGISKEDLLQAISHYKQKVSGDLLVTLEVLEAEIQEPEPRTAVIQGMLANFSQDSALSDLKENISYYFQIK
jgi:AcrR family transcriptional regulator